MDGSVALRYVVTSILILVGAYGVGLGIRAARTRPVEPEPNVVAPPSHLKSPAPVVREDPDTGKSTIQDEEIIPWAEEETVEPEVPDEVEMEETPVVEQEDELAETPQETPQTVGDWRTVWAGLELTPEEQMRLREGFNLARQRWQSMSPAEREAEGARLRDMGIQWQMMSEEEKQAASQGMRDRFEDWRTSGSVELPELSFD